jgi:hypothetical protein
MNARPDRWTRHLQSLSIIIVTISKGLAMTLRRRQPAASALVVYVVREGADPNIYNFADDSCS